MSLDDKLSNRKPSNDKHSVNKSEQMSSINKSEHVYPMRLQKFLARAGVASRRGSENLMTAGRVRVNGKIVKELGSKVDPNKDLVEVDNKVVSLADESVYLLLYKPAGFVSTMSDPHARHTVSELVPTEKYPGLFPVGRLDMDTTGALLFTTDGELAHLLLSPKHKVEKTYKVVVDGKVNENELAVLKTGIELEDGITLPAKVSIDGYASSNGFNGATFDTLTYLTCILIEGKKRQVKRMFLAIGHPVLSLHRSSFGPVNLGEMSAGMYRELTEHEVKELKQAVMC